MKERTIQDLVWNKNKEENRRINQAIYTGWDGGIYRKGVMARVVLRGVMENQGVKKLPLGLL